MRDLVGPRRVLRESPRLRCPPRYPPPCLRALSTSPRPRALSRLARPNVSRSVSLRRARLAHGVSQRPAGRFARLVERVTAVAHHVGRDRRAPLTIARIWLTRAPRATPRKQRVAFAATWLAGMLLLLAVAVAVAVAHSIRKRRARAAARVSYPP